jgi:hypothetical protein
MANSRHRQQRAALFVKQRLPVGRHRSGRSGHRLIQRMRVRGVKLRAGEELSGAVVVEPSLARLEACDYRVTRSRVMFRCMLVWRSITAPDVPAFDTSAKMQPPPAHSRAFDAARPAWLGCGVDAIPLRLHKVISLKVCAVTTGCLAARNAGVALPNFYNIAIRIANVAARLAVLGFGSVMNSAPRLFQNL